MVEERNDILSSAGIHKFFDKISPGGGVHYIEFAESPGIIQRKALMMTCGKGNILTACGFCCLYDLFHTIHNKGLL